VADRPPRKQRVDGDRKPEAGSKRAVSPAVIPRRPRTIFVRKI
jgi:hypothetical protein